MHVFLWLTPLGCAPHEPSLRLLSRTEGTRASAFRSPRDRDSFVEGRSFLRTVLGAHLDLDPRQVRFATGALGKPRLAHANAPEFSFARCSGWALCAVAPGRRIGADIELARPLADLRGVARTSMRKEEHERWLAMPSSERNDHFYRLWTRKEAIGKATGLGISRGTADLPAPFHISRGCCVRVSAQGLDWLVSDLAVGPQPMDPEVMASVCVECPGGIWERCIDTPHASGEEFSAVPPRKTPAGCSLIIRRFEQAS